VGVESSAWTFLRGWSRGPRKGQREKEAERVEFRVADAQYLPFEDDLFDAVITESVTAFPEDKQKAVNEYVRVTKPGGHVGLNESTWLKFPPPPELIAWASQDLGANVQPLTSNGWVDLLEGTGLKEIVAKTYPVNVQDESKGILRRYGWGETLRSLCRMLCLYARSPAYRKFVKEVRQNEITPANLDQYFGYGLYVGRKQVNCLS
jgi:arsenite methyltransferase